MLENHWSMIGQELADVLNKTSYRVQSTLCHVYKRMIWTTTLKLHNMNRSGVVPCNKTVWSRGRTSCYQSISLWIDEALCVTNWFDWIRQILHNIFLCIVHVALRLIYRCLSMHANIIVKISCKYKLCTPFWWYTRGVKCLWGHVLGTFWQKQGRRVTPSPPPPPSSSQTVLCDTILLFTSKCVYYTY